MPPLDLASTLLLYLVNVYLHTLSEYRTTFLSIAAASNIIFHYFLSPDPIGLVINPTLITLVVDTLLFLLSSTFLAVIDFYLAKRINFVW